MISSLVFQAVLIRACISLLIRMVAIYHSGHIWVIRRVVGAALANAQWLPLVDALVR